MSQRAVEVIESVPAIVCALLTGLFLGLFLNEAAAGHTGNAIFDAIAVLAAGFGSLALVPAADEDDEEESDF